MFFGLSLISEPTTFLFVCAWCFDVGELNLEDMHVGKDFVCDNTLLMVLLFYVLDLVVCPSFAF